MLLLFTLSTLALVWDRINMRVFGDRLSPFGLLLFSWVGPLVLRLFNLSSFERSWTGLVWTMILSTTFLLIAITLLARLFMPNRRPTTDGQFGIDTASLTRPSVIICLTVVFFVCFAAYSYQEFITNPVGIPLVAYIKQPLLAREAYHRWGKEGNILGLLDGALFILVPIIYLAARLTRGRTKRWLLLLTAVYPIATLLKLSRIDLIAVLINMAFVEVYLRYYRNFVIARPKVQIYKKIARAVALVLGAASVYVVMISLVSIRVGADTSDLNIFGEMTGFNLHESGFFFPALAEIYGYLALPFENFSNFVAVFPSKMVAGVGLLRPLLSVVKQGTLADLQMSQFDWNFQMWPSNTYPFITLLYAEGGPAWVAVGAIFYASMVSWLYIRFRKRSSLTNLFLYVNTTFGWLWLCSTGGFTVLTFYVNMVFTVGLFGILQRIARGTTSSSEAVPFSSP